MFIKDELIIQLLKIPKAQKILENAYPRLKDEWLNEQLENLLDNNTNSPENIVIFKKGTLTLYNDDKILNNLCGQISLTEDGTVQFGKSGVPESIRNNSLWFNKNKVKVKTGINWVYFVKR